MRINSKDQISGTCSLMALLLATILFVALIAANIIIERPFFEMGLNLQHQYQQLLSGDTLKLISNYFLLIIGPVPIYVLMFLFILFTKRKLDVITHVTFFFISIFIASILAQNLQHPSPFWQNDKISKWSWKCQEGFANPNVHIVMFILFFEPLFTDGYGCCGKRFCIPFLGFIFAITTLFLLNARFYLGLQSLNQILFSLGLGLILLVLYRYGYKKSLYKLFWSLMFGKRICIDMITIIIATIMSIGLPLAFFIINKTSRPVNDLYLNSVNKACSKNFTSEQLQGQALLSTSYVMVSLGIIYGFILLRNTPDAQHPENSHHHHSHQLQLFQQFLLGIWNYHSCLTSILHIFMYILFVAGPFVAAHLLAKILSGVLIKYLVSSIFFFISGLFFSFLITRLTQKCGIIENLPSEQSKQHKQHSSIHQQKI